MAGEFFDNFNNDPVSIEVKTVSYTIPSGQYAKIRVTDFTDDFKLDSVIAIDRYNFTGTEGSALGTKFTNNTSYVLIGNMYGKNGFTGTVAVRGFNTLTVSNNIYTDKPMTMAAGESIAITLTPGESIYQSGTTGFPDAWVYSLVAINPMHEKEFWVPQGTLVEGTKFTVTLYNKQGA